jgi:hypothetical protein
MQMTWLVPVALMLGGRANVQGPAAITEVRSASQPTVADFTWIEGRWIGHLAGVSGEAQMSFMPVGAGQLVGVMRIIDQGKVVLVELISMMDTPDGVELRFRHFSPALDAYETSFKQTMRLTNHLPDRDVFENLVPFDKALMSTQPRTATYIRRGPDDFVAHSDIIDQQGKPSVIEVTYHRAR